MGLQRTLPHPHQQTKPNFSLAPPLRPAPPNPHTFQHPACRELITPRQPTLLTSTKPFFSSYTLASNAPSPPIPSPPPTPTLSLSPPSPALSPGCGSGGGGGARPAAAAPAASRVHISVLFCFLVDVNNMHTFDSLHTPHRLAEHLSNGIQLHAHTHTHTQIKREREREREGERERERGKERDSKRRQRV